MDDEGDTSEEELGEWGGPCTWFQECEADTVDLGGGVSQRDTCLPRERIPAAIWDSNSSVLENSPRSDCTEAGIVGNENEIEWEKRYSIHNKNSGVPSLVTDRGFVR